MKIDQAILSSNSDSSYLDFWPIVSKLWKEKIGVEPILIYIDEKQDVELSEEYGKVFRWKYIKNIPISIQVLWIRYWFPTLFPNKVSIISDIDMLPLSKHYFIDQIKNVSENKYVHINPCIESYGRIPSCYHIALGRTFKKVLNLPERWEDSLSMLHQDFKNPKEKLTQTYWFLDEDYPSLVIPKYKESNPLDILYMPRTGGQNGRRIDRSNWKFDLEKVKSEYYYDCHSARPYEKYKKDIDSICKAALNEKTIENYWHPWGHLNENERDFLIEQLKKLKPKYCLETGFATGRSAATTLCTIKPEKFISIDINLNYAGKEGWKIADKLQNDFENYLVIEGDSKKILNKEFFNKNFKNGIDYAFVDGDHTYEGAKEDIERIYSQMNDGALMIIDDYYSGPPDGCSIPEVNNAVDDFCLENSITCDKWNKNGKGCALIKKKVKVDPKIILDSYPIITGMGFRKYSDFVYDDFEKSDFSNLIEEDGKIIFIKTDYISNFFEKVLPNIKYKINIITHNSAHKISDNYKKYLDNDKIINWYAQNANVEHEKLESIPLGIANARWPHGDIKLLNEIIDQKNYKKELLYLNFDTKTNSSRRKILEDLKDLNYVHFSERKPFKEYLEDLSKCKYAVSPEGMGTDCHRIWECLYLETIPIVKNCHNVSFYKDLPILIIEDWNEISEDLLSKKYEKIFNKFKTTKYKLHIKYWINKIRHKNSSSLIKTLAVWLPLNPSIKKYKSIKKIDNSIDCIIINEYKTSKEICKKLKDYKNLIVVENTNNPDFKILCKEISIDLGRHTLIKENYTLILPYDKNGQKII